MDGDRAHAERPGASTPRTGSRSRTGGSRTERQCVVDTISTKLGQGGYRILELLADLTQADSFRLRVACSLKRRGIQIMNTRIHRRNFLRGLGGASRRGAIP